MEYSTDDGDSWSPYTSNTVITLENVGDHVSFRSTSDNSRYGIASSGHNHGKTFTVTKNCYVYGNILSLVNYDTTLKRPATFKYLFWDCSTITNHPSSPLLLPATTLTEECYCAMFMGCSSLTTAPELPATTMAQECYLSMFSSCSNLTSPPSLPATTMAWKCYSNMFNKCTSLTSAPELPSTNLADYCYQGMFKNCSNLTTSHALPVESLSNYCYFDMFDGCTNLTTAPNLPATTLADYCYYGMFGGCTRLTTGPDLPAHTLVTYCYSCMFWNCSGLKRIKCLAITIPETATQSWVYGVMAGAERIFYIDPSLNPSNPTPWTKNSENGIPTQWTIQRAE